MKMFKIAGSLLLATATACSSGVAPESEGTSKSTTEALWFTTASSYFDQTGADVTAVTRGTNLLDLFRIDGGVLKLLRWNGLTWAETGLSKPSGVASLLKVGAAVNGSRVDVFAVGSDNHIWHINSTNWLNPNNWTPDLPGNPTVWATPSGLRSPIAVTSTGNNDLHVFWWTPSRNIGHSWYGNNLPGGTESGDTAAMTWLKPISAPSEPVNFSALSRTTSTIDLFYPSFTSLAHHWFDGVSWGTTAAPNRETFLVYKDVVRRSSSVSVASTGPNNLEIFTRSDRTDSVTDWRIYHTSFNSTWNSFSLNGAPALFFEEVSHSTSVPAALSAAIVWQTPTPRLDLYGLGSFGGQIWQAVRPL